MRYFDIYAPRSSGRLPEVVGNLPVGAPFIKPTFSDPPIDSLARRRAEDIAPMESYLTGEIFNRRINKRTASNLSGLDLSSIIDTSGITLVHEIKLSNQLLLVTAGILALVLFWKKL